MPLFQGRIVLLVVFAGLACSALNGFLYFTYVLDSYDFLLQHSTLPEALEDQRFDESRPAARRRRAIDEAMADRAEGETRADVARRLDRPEQDGPTSYEIGSDEDPDATG